MVVPGLLRSSLLLRLSITTCVLHALATRAEDVTCKQNFKLFKGSEAGMTRKAHGAPDGCYMFFPNASSWAAANAHCTAWAVNGSLAASRHPAEQAYVIDLVWRYSWGSKFWMSGNSNDAGKDNAWEWGTQFGKTVDFGSSGSTWSQQMIDVLPLQVGAYGSKYPNLVLVNGYRAAYKWMAVDPSAVVSKTTNQTLELPYLCWKPACVPGEDVTSGGLCTSEAASVQVTISETDYTWIYIAAPTVVFVILLSSFLYWLYNYRNDSWNSLVYFITCRDDVEDLLAEIPDEWKKSFKTTAFGVRWRGEKLNVQSAERAMALGGTAMAAATGALLEAGDTHQMKTDTFFQVRRRSLQNQRMSQAYSEDSLGAAGSDLDAEQRAAAINRLPAIKYDDGPPSSRRAPAAEGARESNASTLSLPPMQRNTLSDTAPTGLDEDPFADLDPSRLRPDSGGLASIGEEAGYRPNTGKSMISLPGLITNHNDGDALTLTAPGVLPTPSKIDRSDRKRAPRMTKISPHLPTAPNIGKDPSMTRQLTSPSDAIPPAPKSDPFAAGRGRGGRRSPKRLSSAGGSAPPPPGGARGRGRGGGRSPALRGGGGRGRSPGGRSPSRGRAGGRAGGRTGGRGRSNQVAPNS